MTAFRVYLACVLLAVLGYSGVVVAQHGMGLFPVFFGDIAKLGWPGQFNLDFTFMLGFSALWVAYRHRFRPLGLALASAAFVGGSLFLSVYLLVASARARGDARALLLGDN